MRRSPVSRLERCTGSSATGQETHRGDVSQPRLCTAFVPRLVLLSPRPCPYRLCRHIVLASPVLVHASVPRLVSPSPRPCPYTASTSAPLQVSISPFLVYPSSIPLPLSTPRSDLSTSPPFVLSTLPKHLAPIPGRATLAGSFLGIPGRDASSVSLAGAFRCIPGRRFGCVPQPESHRGQLSTSHQPASIGLTACPCTCPHRSVGLIARPAHTRCNLACNRSPLLDLGTNVATT